MAHMIHLPTPKQAQENEHTVEVDEPIRSIDSPAPIPTHLPKSFLAQPLLEMIQIASEEQRIEQERIQIELRARYAAD